MPLPTRRMCFFSTDLLLRVEACFLSRLMLWISARRKLAVEDFTTVSGLSTTREYSVTLRCREFRLAGLSRFDVLGTVDEKLSPIHGWRSTDLLFVEFERFVSFERKCSHDGPTLGRNWSFIPVTGGFG